jgi:hypothetical protein
MTTKPQFFENDLEVLVTCVTSLDAGLIVFDRRPSAGKTHFARDVAQRLACNTVDADDFLIRKQGAFVRALKLDELRDEVERQSSFARRTLDNQP